MDLFYFAVFGALVLVTIALECQHNNSCSPDGEMAKGLPAFNKFRNNYLLVYSLMMGELETASRSVAWRHARTYSGADHCFGCSGGILLAQLGIGSKAPTSTLCMSTTDTA